jgi:hypothetical protein
MSDDTKYLLQSLEGKLDKVEDKQDKLLEVVSEQNEILARMQVIQQQHHDSLEEHHRRTTIAEERLMLLETKDHQFQAFIKGAAWVMGGLMSIAAVAYHYIK